MKAIKVEPHQVVLINAINEPMNVLMRVAIRATEGECIEIAEDLWRLIDKYDTTQQGGKR